MSRFPVNPIETLAEAAELLTGCPDEEVAAECAAAVVKARAAVAELVEAGRKLRMHRAGVADANAMFVAPVVAKEDATAFVAALAKFGGAA